jgi:hypothetical protein
VVCVLTKIKNLQMLVKHNRPQFDALCIAAFASRKLASSFLCWGSGAFRRTLFLPVNWLLI